jgi:hypothetical protein
LFVKSLAGFWSLTELEALCFNSKGFFFPVVLAVCFSAMVEEATDSSQCLVACPQACHATSAACVLFHTVQFQGGPHDVWNYSRVLIVIFIFIALPFATTFIMTVIPVHFLFVLGCLI